MATKFNNFIEVTPRIKNVLGLPAYPSSTRGPVFSAASIQVFPERVTVLGKARFLHSDGTHREHTVDASHITAQNFPNETPHTTGICVYSSDSISTRRHAPHSHARRSHT